MGGELVPEHSFTIEELDLVIESIKERPYGFGSQLICNNGVDFMNVNPQEALEFG